ncbi:MAG: hypothetical protein A3I00_04680 [Betaproteobacteria bacterium RIFCSPLOWO2_02_FULL_64_12]|nr:MAG: hypothetical protein A3I00_04680 [Betaproteobacteria bacterium RIFCSPLOWO2_02_FULL_64_12]
MRDLIQVGIERGTSAGTGQGRLARLREEAEKVAEAFARYLTHYPPKTRRTRHGLLGPVPEIIKLAGRPLMTPGQATGRAIRIHEMAQEGRRLGRGAMASLEEVTQEFFELVERCPMHLRKALRDRVIDHVYFLARKKEAHFWVAWNEWLQQRYADIAALNSAWSTSFKDWSVVRYRDSEAGRLDFDEFRKARRERGEAIVDADANESEAE